MEKKAMVYIQSGGPTAVINTSLYAAILEARRHPEKINGIYGSRFGIEGLINDELIDINQENQEDIDLLLQTPGSILGTSRYKLPSDIHHPIYSTIVDTLKKHNIGYVFVNGGNDSMDTCHKLSTLFSEINSDIIVIGVPKTIDNDLACTDHSLGFPSAAKCVINVVQSITLDAASYRKGKVYIIEVMGRNAGWLTAACDLLDEKMRPDLIYLPETKFDLDEFLQDVKRIHDRDGYVLVAISEGIVFNRDTRNAFVDAFNHIQLGGVSSDLCKIVENTLHIPTRSVELSLLQRANPMCISAVDQKEAIAVGTAAVLNAVNGVTGKMIAINRSSNKPYECNLEVVDLCNIANAERVIPESMINCKEYMNDSFRDYLDPLIKGETSLKWENGILKYSHFKFVPVK